ncbi:MAG: T9SS type A sorting domain-containing protein [candidate division KSB1 bacterium]|nr:T9SS type A sorting domain-containing protein [candidate division KSB1 bacterium]MDZ7305116.1 T9SS type A sorting domain-containing protein [candidate division KSB1 bacterium]MDZ7314183.1 T9SS type A sorting domain-containing protein [candidate division KSB1 bacterium]
MKAMKERNRQQAANFIIVIMLLALYMTKSAFAQTYQVGVPVCDTLVTQITSYSYLGGCGPDDYLWFRLTPSLIPYVTGLSFQIIITEINGKIWSSLSDTVKVGDILPVPAPVDSGVKIFMTLYSSFNFITRIVGTPTVAYENYYCEIKTSLTAAACSNSLDYYGEGQICQVQPATAVKMGNENIPTQFQLLQNYPNPFNAVTTIEFDLRRSSEVSLKIFNLHGEEIVTLLNQNKLAAGRYKIKWNGENLPSGIYVYRLQADGNYLAMRKLVLLK